MKNISKNEMLNTTAGGWLEGFCYTLEGVGVVAMAVGATACPPLAIATGGCFVYSMYNLIG